MMSMPDKMSVPPKTSWKPGRVKVVRALYQYTAQRDDELSFEAGDLLYVYDKDTDPNWWKAKCGDKEGLVPANYVKEQTEEIAQPLHDAARRGNIIALREYLKQGVSGTSLDAAGNTPLYWAARVGHFLCVEELLKLANPGINAQNNMGDTPLHVAASHGHLNVIKALLENGADPTIRNCDGLTAEDVSCGPVFRETIQRSQRQYIGSYGYTDEDYNDESD